MLKFVRRLLIALDIANWLAVAGLVGWGLTLVFGLPRAERFLQRAAVPGGIEDLRHALES